MSPSYSLSMEEECPCTTDTSDQVNETSISTNTNSTQNSSDCTHQTILECNAGCSHDKLMWPAFHCKWPIKEYLKRTNKCLAVKMKNQYNYAKPFAYSEISEGIPKKHKGSKLGASNLKTKIEEQAEEQLESIDIYYFDHGNSAYYRTTDSHPIITMEKCAERTSDVATRFWAEIFGTIHIGVAFVVAFILQLFRFMLYSIIRPLTIGLLQLFADYFIKPFLSILFNALIQPILILFYNIFTSIRDLCEPIAQGFGYFLAELVKLCRACRVVEITNNNTTPIV